MGIWAFSHIRVPLLFIYGVHSGAFSSGMRYRSKMRRSIFSQPEDLVHQYK